MSSAHSMELARQASRLRPSSVRPVKRLSPTNKQKDKKIKELEDLVETISRGKYMWESTFDAISSPVMIISADYTIERANRSAAKSARMDVRDLIKTKCYETFAGINKPCRGCPLTETLDSKTQHSCDLDPFKRFGHQYEVDSYPLVSLTDEKWAVNYYRDVTEEKELQRQLLHSEKMAAVGTLAGGIAHEINNPLGGLLAFTQLVMRDLEADHKNQSDLKEIEEAALRCKRIVQDLLDFSRQNKEESMIPVQINDVLKKIIPFIQVQARTSRISVTCDYKEGLPLIRGNFHKLQQVFLNLITNAFQAIGKGGHLVLRTNLSQDGLNIIAEVRDDGPGIDEEYLDKIFDPYFTTKPQGQGTGLGLSITYGIVQEHKGGIEVKSEKGKGTTFVLSFPTIDQIS